MKKLKEKNKKIKADKEFEKEKKKLHTECRRCGVVVPEDNKVLCATCKLPLHKECANGIGEFDKMGYVKGLVHYCSYCIDDAVEKKNKQMAKRTDKMNKKPRVKK